MSGDVLYVLLFLLWNVIQWMMWYYTLHKLFPPKLSPALTYGIELVLSVIGICVLYYLVGSNVPGKLVVPILLFILPTLLLHRSSLFRKLVACMAILFSMVCTETVCFFFMPAIMLDVVDRSFYSIRYVFYYIDFLFCQGIFLLLVYFLFRRWDRNVSGYLTAKEGWLFFLFPLSQYILLAGWYKNFVDKFSTFQLIASAVVAAFCTTADLLLFRTLKRNSENARLRAQNDLLQKQISVQNSYYQALAKNYSDMSRLRHDIGNHLFTIQVLLQENKKNEAMQYAAELQQSKLVKSLMSDCHNTIVSAFLRHKMDDFTSQGIDIHSDVSLPAHINISHTDIIIALGNILDNAADACKQTDTPRIRLTLTYCDHLLHFDVTNTCPPQQQRKTRRIPYLDRGLGSGILQALAEKYSGSVNRYPDGDIYHTVLVMKESSDPV